MVLVTSIKDIGEGVIQDTSAFAKFAVTFECVVFRPFKGEVLDCVVTSVNKARTRGASAQFPPAAWRRRRGPLRLGFAECCHSCCAAG